ncbi:2Fe-2S iron-sulfur cluster-binding protein [Rhodosalinus sp. FB01]|uniref:PDR/VanB family oxidoreductase n=1 Tax=Rhodosalinus sp. FB01 TaxID=3239194 RepID=UPI0035265ED8
MTKLTLTVASAEMIAEDIKEFRLERPDKAALPAFTSGAHIHVDVPSGGTRQYSLVNDPVDDTQYVIAVKREAGGTGGSVSLIDSVDTGDTIEVSEPQNDFELSDKTGDVLLVAGGIGITPILSMARVLSRTGKRRFRLAYLTRSPELTAYRQEILDGPLAEVSTIHHDRGNPEDAFDLDTFLQPLDDVEVYCCGPTGLLAAVRDKTSGWPRGCVHFEDFGTDTPAERSGDEAFVVVIKETGARYVVPPGKTILEVLTEQGLDAPSSCEAGTCGTCRTKLVDGEADHRDLVLFDDEYDDNIIICCSRAKTPEITISFEA